VKYAARLILKEKREKTKMGNMPRDMSGDIALGYEDLKIQLNLHMVRDTLELTSGFSII